MPGSWVSLIEQLLRAVLPSFGRCHALRAKLHTATATSLSTPPLTPPCPCRRLQRQPQLHRPAGLLSRAHALPLPHMQRVLHQRAPAGGGPGQLCWKAGAVQSCVCAGRSRRQPHLGVRVASASEERVTCVLTSSLPFGCRRTGAGESTSGAWRASTHPLAAPPPPSEHLLCCAVDRSQSCVGEQAAHFLSLAAYSSDHVRCDGMQARRQLKPAPCLSTALQGAAAGDALLLPHVRAVRHQRGAAAHAHAG